MVINSKLFKLVLIDEFKIYNDFLDSNIILNEYNSYLKTNTIFSNK